MTLVLAGLVVTVVGLLIVQRVRDGLLHAKTNAAVQVAYADDQSTQNLLNTLQLADPNAIEGLLSRQVFALAARGSQAGVYDVIVVPPTNDEGTIKSGGIVASSVPTRLVTAVQKQVSPTWNWTYAELQFTNGRREAGLVVGSQLGTINGTYQIYHAFPFTPEAATLHLVRRTVLFSCLGLIGLLAAIAALVTHQVVDPVRYAARTAERLAAGRLQERMRVHGEDELARLGTSFNRMADSLQRHISRLEDLSRMQRRFVADVSHELRTPLTTVRMAAEVLHAARAMYPPEVARSAELLQAELDRFESLLVDLLEISRYDAGAAVLEPEPADIREIVRRVIDGTSTIASRKETAVVVVAPDEPVIADIDIRRIERVLRNLVVNAIEHGEGRNVEVHVAGDDHGVAVTVADHGVGLGPGEAAMVFQRFWRADRSRARTSGGTGLGLAIALEDVRLHGGWLHAAGERGKGSVFRITLPRHRGEPLVESPLGLAPPSPDAVEAAGA